MSGLNQEEDIIFLNRTGDHIWYVSNMKKFRKDYPNWKQKYFYSKNNQRIS